MFSTKQKFRKCNGENGLKSENKIPWLSFITFHWVTRFLIQLQSQKEYVLPELGKKDSFVYYANLLDKNLKDVKVRKVRWFDYFQKKKKSYLYVKKKEPSEYGVYSSTSVETKGESVKGEQYYYLDYPGVLWAVLKAFRQMIIKILSFRILDALFLIAVALVLEKYVVTMKKNTDPSLFFSASKILSGLFLILLLFVDIVVHCVLDFCCYELIILIEVTVMYYLFNINLANADNNLLFSRMHKTLDRSEKPKRAITDTQEDSYINVYFEKKKDPLYNCDGSKKREAKEEVKNCKNGRGEYDNDNSNTNCHTDATVNAGKPCKNMYTDSSFSSDSFFLSEKSCSTGIKQNSSAHDCKNEDIGLPIKHSCCHSFYYKNARYVGQYEEEGEEEGEKKSTYNDNGNQNLNFDKESFISVARKKQFLEFIRCYKSEKESKKRQRGAPTGHIGGKGRAHEDDMIDLSIYNIMFTDTPYLSYFINSLINFIIIIMRFTVSFFMFYYKMGQHSTVYGIVLTVIIYGSMCFFEIMSSCFKQSYLKYRDKRLDNVHHVLKEFKLIKMLNWERMAFDYVDYYRKKEMKFCKIRIYLSSLSNYLSDISSKIVEVIVLFCFLKDEINKKKQLNLSQILTPLFIYKSLVSGISNFPNLMNDIIEGLIAIKRIDKYIYYYLYHNNINMYFKYKDNLEGRARQSSFSIDDYFASADEERKKRKRKEKGDKSSKRENPHKRGTDLRNISATLLYCLKNIHTVLEKKSSDIVPFENHLKSTLNGRPIEQKRINKGDMVKSSNHIYERNCDDSERCRAKNKKEVVVKLHNCYFSINLTNEKKNQYILKNINFELKNNTVALIVGDIGSGKTAFFQSILGYFKLSYGHMYVKNLVKNIPIIYVPQFRWVNVGTIRSMILFGNKFDAAIYNCIVNQSELVNDFLTFKDKDLRFINDGHNMSEGQKTRICLARALYHHYWHMAELSRKHQQRKEHFLNLMLQKERLEKNNKDDNANSDSNRKGKMVIKEDNLEGEYCVKPMDSNTTQMDNTAISSSTKFSLSYRRTMLSMLSSFGERYQSEGKDNETCSFIAENWDSTDHFVNLDVALRENNISYLYLIDDLFTSLDPCICNKIFVSLFCENGYNHLYKDNCSFIATVNENILKSFLKTEILERLQYKINIYKLEGNTLSFKGGPAEYMEMVESTFCSDDGRKLENKKKAKKEKKNMEEKEKEEKKCDTGDDMLNWEKALHIMNGEKKSTVNDKTVIEFPDPSVEPMEEPTSETISRDCFRHDEKKLMDGTDGEKDNGKNSEKEIEKDSGKNNEKYSEKESEKESGRNNEKYSEKDSGKKSEKDSEKEKNPEETKPNSGINKVLVDICKTSSNRRNSHIHSFISEVETDEHVDESETYYRGSIKKETFCWYFKSVSFFLLIIIICLMIAAVLTEEIKNFLIVLITKYNVSETSSAEYTVMRSMAKGNTNGTIGNSIDHNASWEEQTRFLRLFLILPLTSLVLSLICYILIAQGSILSAQRIHTLVLKNILHAPMHVFYSSNVGNIMNRFSTDINVVDVGILKRVYRTVYGLFRVSFTITLLIIMVGHTILILPLIFILIYFFVFRRYSEGCKEAQRGYLRSHTPLCNMYSNIILGKTVINVYKKNLYFLRKYQERALNFKNYINMKWAITFWASYYIQMIGLILTSFYIVFPYVYFKIHMDNMSDVYYQRTLSTAAYCITFSCSLSIIVKNFLYDYTHNEKEMCSIQRLEECAKMIDEEYELNKENKGIMHSVVSVDGKEEMGVLDKEGIGTVEEGEGGGEEELLRKQNQKGEEEVSDSDNENDNCNSVNRHDGLYFLGTECNNTNLETGALPIPVTPTIIKDKEKYGILFENVYVSYKERTNIDAKKNIYSYSHGRCCLWNINIFALKNQKIGIVGKSGSGKSTIIMSILGLIPTIKGQITIEGEDIRSLNRCARNNIIGVLPQSSFVFFNWNIRTFIDPYQNFKDEEIVEAFKMIGINLNQEDLSKYIYKQRKKKKQNISYRFFGKGRAKTEKMQKNGNNFISLTDDCIRYLSLVRLFLNRHKYKLILFDEIPAFNFQKIQEDNTLSNFFTSDVKSLDYILRNYFSNSTVIIVAHDTSTLSCCDFVYVLRKGEVVYRCSYKDVETQNKLAELLEKNEEERMI